MTAITLRRRPPAHSATHPVSTYPLTTGELAAARLALIECVCGTFEFCDRDRCPRSPHEGPARLKWEPWLGGSDSR